MSESINIENKKQNRQKPPLSFLKIAGEILVGLALGFILLWVVYCAGFGLIGSNKPMAALFFLLFFVSCPLLYGIGCTVGVYLVGSIGKQTGSLSLSLVGSFMFGIVVLFPSFSLLDSRKVNLVLLLLLLLIPPIMATLCFNLNRRYKESPSD